MTWGALLRGWHGNARVTVYCPDLETAEAKREAFVREGFGSDWTVDGPWFACATCRSKYRGRGAALQCCTEQARDRQQRDFVRGETA